MSKTPPGWGFTARPSVTLGNAVFRGMVGGTGAKKVIMSEFEEGRFVPSPHGTGVGHAEITRITVDEAAALQSFPPGWKFAGGKGKVGLQIGNAVPPLQARVNLEHLWAQPTKRKDMK